MKGGNYLCHMDTDTDMDLAVVDLVEVAVVVAIHAVS